MPEPIREPAPTTMPDPARTPEHLLPLVYEELRSLAAGLMARERYSHTLQATALVNEAYLRLVKSDKVRYQDIHHFYLVAATTIRRILTDHARAKNADKRGGSHAHADMNSVEVADSSALGSSALSDEELIALDDALAKLSLEESRYAEVVELRFFAGLTAEQTATVLGVSVMTVHRDWRYAKARLRRWFHDAEDPS